MDDITRTQQSFARKARKHPEHRFEDVYHLLCREDWIRFALDHVLANKGSRTPGIDHVTRHGFTDETYTQKFIAGLQTTLRTHAYDPAPVRRIYIPKPDGRQRPLGIPTVSDRVVQMLLKMLLEPIWESDFLDCSSGFRPGRRTMDCIAMCYRLINDGQKYFWVVEGDIKGCFDHIQQDILLQLISKRVQDRRVLKLIEAFLNAGFMEGELFQKTDAGTPQGGIFSPLLANIYLHEMDRYWWEKYGELEPAARKKRRQQGQGNNRLLRYADDFIILTNGPRAEAERLREEFQQFLQETLQLALSEEKTLVTHVNEGFDFLGFNVKRYRNPKKGTRPVTLVKPSTQAMHRLQAKIGLMLGQSHTADHPFKKMQAVNRVLRGWIGYYQHCNVKEIAYSLDYWVSQRMVQWFSAHHHSGMKDALARYKRQQEKRWNLAVMDDKGQPLFLYRMGDQPVTRYQDRKRTNPYLTQGETEVYALPEEPNLDLEHTWNGGERWPGWTEAKLARREYDKGCCVICGSMNNLDVHHLHPRRWNQREHGDDRLENLRTLCENCHIKVEQGLIVVNGNGAPDEVKVSRPVRRGV